jgi:hypothetical protein
MKIQNIRQISDSFSIEEIVEAANHQCFGFRSKVGGEFHPIISSSLQYGEIIQKSN